MKKAGRSPPFDIPDRSGAYLSLPDAWASMV